MVASKNIAVVGQGVMGLTCAHRLLERGHAVTVFSKEAFASTTSMAAGAYWWPHKAYPKERIAAWAEATHNEYRRARSEPRSGIHFEKHFRFCLDPDDSAYARHLTEEWVEIDGADHGVPCHEAFRVVLLVIDVPVYMPFLNERVAARGARFRRKELASPAALFPAFDLVVNCTGVGARRFVDDREVFPIRGQSVRVARPDGLRASTRLYEKEDQFTLILPRSDDVILGGTAQEGSWDRTPSDRDTRGIIERCAALVPEVDDCEVLGVSVGLRPGRPTVRLELESIAPGRPVIHNYGHGGGGYTVAWGCADEVAALASDYFLESTGAA